MSDWLSEIEEYGKTTLGGVNWDYDKERMARVIRELVAAIKFEDELPMMYETEEAAQQSYDYRRNRSPDAKELLK